MAHAAGEEPLARRRSSGGNAVVNISARVDDGVRVLCALAASGTQMPSEQRGADGGYRLARPADTITRVDVIGPLVGPSPRSGATVPNGRATPGQPSTCAPPGSSSATGSSRHSTRSPSAGS